MKTPPTEPRTTIMTEAEEAMAVALRRTSRRRWMTASNQSGEREVAGGTTKAGKVNLRRALCQVASGMMHRGDVELQMA